MEPHKVCKTARKWVMMMIANGSTLACANTPKKLIIPNGFLVNL